MKGRDDESAWAHQDEGEELYARANSKRQRRVEAPGPRVEHTTAWTAALLALLVGVALAVFLLSHGRKQAGRKAGTSGPAAQAPAPAIAQSQPPPVPAVAPVAGNTSGTQTKDEEAALIAQIAAANAQAAVVPPPQAQPQPLPLPQLLPPPPPPPPPVPAELPGQKPPAAPEEAPRIEETIIGTRIPLGKLAVEVEDYWLEADPPADIACAALSGCISNHSAAAVALPQVEVTLLDGEQREYKACKSQLATNVTLNPLMKERGRWAFQVPAKMPMWCAQFKTKDGRDLQAVRIGVNKRTLENAQLAETEDYRAVSDEMKAFASPRFLQQQQHRKELAKMDPIISDMDAIQKRLDKLAKPRKVAEAAVAAAKSAADKRADDAKDTEAALKDLESNRPAFIHDAPRWERQCGEARVRLERIVWDAAAADKTLKDKLAQRDKVLNQEKEEQKQFDVLQKKFDAQRKVIEDIEKKMAE